MANIIRRWRRDYNNLASNLQAQGRYAEAERHFRKAIEIMDRVLKKDHPNMAVGLTNLAYVIDQQGHYAKAEPIHREALVMTSKMLGPNHPNTALATLALAANLNNQGQHGQAEPFYFKAIEVFQQRFWRGSSPSGRCL